MAYKISTDCVACGTCIDECPVGAIHEGEHYSIDVVLARAFARVGRLVSNNTSFFSKNAPFGGVITRNPSFFCKKCNLNLANINFFL